MEEAIKFVQVRRGIFVHLEDPEKGLRADPTVRHLKMSTFPDLRTIILKRINNEFSV